MKEVDGNEKTDISNNNGSDTANTANTNTPHIPGSPGIMQFPIYQAHPQMFYYQPFRPQAGRMNPMGMYPPPQPYGYINPYQQHMPHYPNVAGYPVHPVVVPTARKPENIQKIETVMARLPKPQTQLPKKPAITSNTTNVPSYNLDDPEELEKWKAERRKKFPSAKKEGEVESSKPAAESKEEGALSESDESEKEETPTLKRKRTCKYFARGKCTKGDSCPFEHISIQKLKRPNTTSTAASRTTIFENLMKIEEKENMLKFFECIKIIIKK